MATTGRVHFLTALRIIVTALVLASPLLGNAQPSTPQPSDSAKQPLGHRIGALRAQLEKELDRANVPAAALVIVDAQVNPKNSKQPLKTILPFGSATPNTPFRLGSITKTFTALALLHAAEAQATPLSSPAAPVVGANYWSNRFQTKNPVTLGQLVELSAGFSDISSAEFASAVPLERKQALLAHRATHFARWPPGQQHSYSNLIPAFTALAVEALTQQTFETYLHRHVLKPLGMPNASLAPLAALPGGYEADGKTLIPYWHTIYPAFGGLNATPTEFSDFLLRLTTGDLGKPLIAALEHRGKVPIYQPLTTAAARAGLTMGYGAGIYGWETRGHFFAGHGGDADGYRSRYAIMPGANRGYFLVINTDNPRLLRSLTHKVEAYLTADRTRPQEQPREASHSNTALADTTNTVLAHARPFAGNYVRASQRFNADTLATCDQKQPTLSLKNDELLWRRGNKTQSLIATGKGLYRKKNNTLASVALVLIDGKRHLQGELGNWLHAEDASRCAN